MYTSCSSNVALPLRNRCRETDIGNSLLQPISNSDAEKYRRGNFLNLQGKILFVDQDSVCKNSLRGRLLAGCGVCAELYTAVRGLLPQRGMQKMSELKNLIELKNISMSFDGETVLDVKSYTARAYVHANVN